MTALSQVVLLDLDDTILHFSFDQPDFWSMALDDVLGGADEATLRSLREAIGRESDEFWSQPARAYWGRQNMYEARRRIARAALARFGMSEANAEAVGDHMTNYKEEHVRPFDGVFDTLQRLLDDGHRLALLTNGSSRFQRRKLERFALQRFFDVVLVEGELGFGKPDARVFGLALRQLRVAAADCCMVGDNLTADIAGAQAVGIRGIWNDVYGRGLPGNSAVVPSRVIRRITEL